MVKHKWDDKAEEPAAESEAASAAPVASGMVRVKCIVESGPWTDTKALAKDEEADVPEEIAKALEDKKLVERVK